MHELNKHIKCRFKLLIVQSCLITYRYISNQINEKFGEDIRYTESFVRIQRQFFEIKTMMFKIMLLD